MGLLLLLSTGADPKSVLCSFFKQGQCAKGDKCKFSHDLNIERKAEKRSMYCDMRDQGQLPPIHLNSTVNATVYAS